MGSQKHIKKWVTLQYMEFCSRAQISKCPMHAGSPAWGERGGAEEEGGASKETSRKAWSKGELTFKDGSFRFKTQVFIWFIICNVCKIVDLFIFFATLQQQQEEIKHNF